MRDDSYTMGTGRERVLAIVYAHPGSTDRQVHAATRTTRYTESTVKHLLRLRDAGLVRCEGSAAKWERRWYPADQEDTDASS